MARKNLFLVVSLLLMVGSLIVGILLSDAGEPAPAFGSPGVFADGADDATTREGATADDANAAEVTAAEQADSGSRRIVAAKLGAGTQRSVRGRLVLPSGSGASEVALELGSAQRDGIRDSGEAAGRKFSSVSDAAGRFEFAVPAKQDVGPLSIEQQANLLFEANAKRTMYFVGSTETIDLGDIAVIQAIVVAGTVVDELDRPVDGVTVDLRPTQPLESGFASVTTDATGRFEFNVAAGVHRLSSASSEHLPTSQTVEVAVGEDRPDIVVRLRRGGSISGFVYDDLGQPIEGAKVAAFRQRKIDANTKVDTIDADEAATSKADGGFVLGGIGPGESVRLRAWAKRHGSVVQSAVAAGRSDVKFNLARNGSIVGQLVDVAGEPVAGSDIKIAREGPLENVVIRGGRAWKTGADGKFTIEDVEVGSVRVQASGPRHRTVSSDAIVVQPGVGSAPVKLVAEVGASVAVLVLGADNEPISGAKVTVEKNELGSDGSRFERRVVVEENGKRSETVETSDDALGRGQTDENGRVTISGLPSGSVVLRASHEAHAPARPAHLILPRVGEVEANLTLQAGGFVSVTTVDATGAPRGDAKFKLIGPQSAGAENSWSNSRSDRSGNVRLGPLAAGSYRAVLVKEAVPLQVGDMQSVMISGMDTELEASVTSFEVVADQTAKVRLAYPILTTVAGVVTSATGAAMGVIVKLRPAGEGVNPFEGTANAKTDADGNYALKDVQAGDYVLSWGRRTAIVRHELDISIPAGQPKLRRDLELRGGAVRVVVNDSTGDALQNAQVSLVRDGQEEANAAGKRGFMVMSIDVDSSGGAETLSMTSGGPGTVDTDDEGEALIEDVPPGRYTIVVKHRKHQEARIPGLVITAGSEATPAAVNMQPGGFIRGRVAGFPNDAEFKIAFLEIRTAGVAGSERPAPYAMNGVVKVNGLTPGAYELRARTPERKDYGPWVEVKVVAGERARVEVPLR